MIKFNNRFKCFMILFILFINYANSVHHFELNEAKIKERLVKGKDELESILVNSKKNTCWHQCIETLKNGCKDMDDTERSRLAVKLTSCHLEKSGMNTYQCTEKMTIPECTSKMSELAFTTYTNFYISTENICYYLQSELFQSQTEAAVNLLIDSTVDTLQSVKQIYLQSQLLSDNIEQSNLAQQKLMNQQQSLKSQLEQSMDYLDRITITSNDLKSSLRDTTLKQDNLLQSQKELSEQHQQSSKVSLDILSQIKDSANFISSNTVESLDNQNKLLTLQKQAIGNLNGIGEITDMCLSKQREIMISQDRIAQSNQIIVGILDGLTTLSNTILSEFIDFKSLFYYISLTLFIYFLTLQKRLQSARIPLYLGLIVQLFIERSITATGSYQDYPRILLDLFHITNDVGSSTSFGIQYKFIIIGKLRKLFFGYLTLMLVCSLYFYRDYERLNHQLLLDLNETNQTLLKLLNKSIKKQKKYKPNTYQEKNSSLLARHTKIDIDQQDEEEEQDEFEQ